jgi:hypothetical protein
LAKIAQALGVSVGALYSEESVTVRKVEDPSGAALGPSDSERTVIEPSAEAGSNLASLLRRLGSPTQHFANPNLIRELEGLSNREFYATIEELDKEIEFLTVELDRRRKEAIPGTPSYLATMRFWDTTGRLYLALKMLIRARDNVEPQEVHVEEILKLSRELSELTGVAG